MLKVEVDKVNFKTPNLEKSVKDYKVEIREKSRNLDIKARILRKKLKL